jgi:hypothetical protein
MIGDSKRSCDVSSFLSTTDARSARLKLRLRLTLQRYAIDVRTNSAKRRAPLDAEVPFLLTNVSFYYNQ